MRTEPVEIYADEPNRAVMRQPGRKYPGVLIQGDDLYQLCLSADRACASLNPAGPEFAAVNELRNRLWSRLNHYRAVLEAHGVGLPFTEQPARRPTGTASL